MRRWPWYLLLFVLTVVTAYIVTVSIFPQLDVLKDVIPDPWRSK
jgi:hypothetical protein